MVHSKAQAVSIRFEVCEDRELRALYHISNAFGRSALVQFEKVLQWGKSSLLPAEHERWCKKDRFTQPQVWLMETISNERGSPQRVVANLWTEFSALNR